jgi:hypothetical protein
VEVAGEPSNAPALEDLLGVFLAEALDHLE